MRTHVIFAVLKRNLMSYFSGVLGYLFIVVFVIAAASSAFNAQFFTNNLANLDQLTAAFPYLLLFIIPAITMTAWAEEKRLGTDELLFTLPAADFEILLGKYLSLVVVYGVALAFSLTQLFVLGYYADPDWGLLLTTYSGYWLAGSALISLGMFASVLTSSVTVAFVLGAAICAVPIFIGHLATSRPAIDNPTLVDNATDMFNSFCGELSLGERLNEFSIGVVPFSGMAYFLSLIIFSLYLNAVFISKRHWVSDQQGLPVSGHFAIRVVCLLVALLAGNSVITTASEALGLRFDMTGEKLYTLSDTTHELVSKIENKVTIQAFISPDVPRDYVGQQTRLKGLLRQYDRMSSQIEVRFVDVTPFSEAAEEAEHFGITATPVQSEVDGRFQRVDVFMGAVITGSFDEVIVPFFDIGTSVEYELTRSVRTVSQKDRLTVGMLRTDAKVNGGFDMSSMRSSPEWRIQRELKKQYKIVEVSPDSPIIDQVDVLIAAVPSSLTDPQMATFVDYVKSGKPVLVLDDPLPLVDPRMSPSQQKPQQGGGGMFGGGQQPPEPRADEGNAGPLVDALGISWQNDAIVWDQTNPHPSFVDLPQDYVFITPLNGNPEAISTKSDVTSGLQELLMLYSGRIRPRENSGLKFEPLLRIGLKSGVSKWSDLMAPSFFGMQFQDPSRVRREQTGEADVVAAHITGEKGEKHKINVIYVADVDIVSDALFNVVQSDMHGLKLDNVKFILNCVDVLAGDTSYVDLRKRRPQHRTLTEVQREADQFREHSQEEREKAEKEAEDALEKVSGDLEKEIEKIDADESLTSLEKRQRMEIARQRKQRELDVQKANIDRDKQEKLSQLKAREQRQIKQTEDSFRFWAVIFPPIPSILLGMLVLGLRLTAEQKDIEEVRRLSRQ
ncbi:MAG: Gldg family protein [Planctomycetota bacterium]|nr:Gldg family protein [Planctomycetota bacterium]MDA1162809.1 Gldg family protein [Planctomycetota bacterium]